LAGGSGSRTAIHPLHDKRSFRRAAGLEAALVDNQPMEIRALCDGDDRVVVANVAGPAALMVAKLFKIGERADNALERLVDKDAHDLYRLLVAIDTVSLAEGLGMLRGHDLAVLGHDVGDTPARLLTGRRPPSAVEMFMSSLLGGLHAPP
jgi:hypothetical protein